MGKFRSLMLLVIVNLGSRRLFRMHYEPEKAIFLRVSSSGSEERATGAAKHGDPSAGNIP